MRVAYIVPSLDDTTGWGRWANDFLRHIGGLDVDWLVLAPPSSTRHIADSSKGDARFILPEFFDYFQSRTGIRRLPAIARYRRALVTAGEADLVHSFDAHPWGLYGDWLARRLDVPHVLTTHGRYGYVAQHRWLDRRVYSGVLRRAAAVVAVSNAVRDAVLDAFGTVVPASKVGVLQNPVDESQVARPGHLPTAVPSDGPVIVSVTRFIPVKDLETAVRAFRLVRQRHPTASYWIIGPGNGPHNPYFRRIEQFVVGEGIEGVHIVGRISKEELAAFYQRATLLLHTARRLPDDFEASGLILLEAGLFGLPAVASASGGIPEVVSHDRTGLLAEEGDSSGLAAAMCRLIEDEGTRRRLGEANRERARLRNWSSYAAAQRALYDAATRGSPPWD